MTSSDDLWSLFSFSETESCQWNEWSSWGRGRYSIDKECGIHWKTTQELNAHWNIVTNCNNLLWNAAFLYTQLVIAIVITHIYKREEERSSGNIDRSVTSREWRCRYREQLCGYSGKNERWRVVVTIGGTRRTLSRGRILEMRLRWRRGRNSHLTLRSSFWCFQSSGKHVDFERTERIVHYYSTNGFLLHSCGEISLKFGERYHWPIAKKTVNWPIAWFHFGPSQSRWSNSVKSKSIITESH